MARDGYSDCWGWALVLLHHHGEFKLHGMPSGTLQVYILYGDSAVANFKLNKA